LTPRLRVARAIVVAFAVATLAKQSNAQDSAHVSLSPPPPARTAAGETSARKVFITRTALGTVGWFAGAIGGAYTGYSLRRDCYCDDPGLGESIIGMAIGSVLGTATAASIPALGRNCRFENRFGRALLGSVGGFIVGGLISISTKDETAIVVVPISSAAGATLAIGHC
jgi:hypothetical protein